MLAGNGLGVVASFGKKFTEQCLTALCSCVYLCKERLKKCHILMSTVVSSTEWDLEVPRGNSDFFCASIVCHAAVLAIGFHCFCNSENSMKIKLSSRGTWLVVVGAH